MFFEILSLFPNMFDGVFSESIVKRAIDQKIITLSRTNIRDFSEDKHARVDDYPYGGGPGMVMKPEPIAKAIKHIQQKYSLFQPKVICLNAQGEPLTQSIAQELSQEEGLILLCGRYKGIDFRVHSKYVDREICIGDYILSGGEIPAMVLIDCITRLLPSALGNSDSIEDDSFYNNLLSSPQFTRPETFEDMQVPEILLHGHHENIAQWRKKKAIQLTQKMRPDLWKQYKDNEKQNNE